ncbi:MAG: hypothetical protein HUJ90_03640 [Bacteroidales bacterium]|nr:hypothetical protein [Bacteroidales bacterium]
MKKFHFEEVHADESMLVIGGVDKNVKDFMYYLGYAFGLLVNSIVSRYNQLRAAF